jgi:small subunit ribosomal protein S3
MSAGAKGVKIICSGRLGNAELARTESQMLGAIPLQTLQAEVDYACSVAITTVGTIGIKVWIYRGRYGDQPVQVDNQQRGDGRFRRRGRR